MSTAILHTLRWLGAVPRLAAVSLAAARRLTIIGVPLAAALLLVVAIVQISSLARSTAELRQLEQSVTALQAEHQELEVRASQAEGALEPDRLFAAHNFVHVERMSFIEEGEGRVAEGPGE